MAVNGYKNDSLLKNLAVYGDSQIEGEILMLTTEHLQRCICSLESALAMYQKAANSIEQDVFRNAIEKGFELTQEISFKLLKRALKDFGHGAKKLDATPIKELLRLSATHSLMSLKEVERWFAYRDNRNNTAHDYGEGFAKDTLRLLPNFIADAKVLETILHARFNEEA